MCMKIDLGKLYRAYKKYPRSVFEKIDSQISENFIKIEKNYEKFKVFFFSKTTPSFFYKFMCIKLDLKKLCRDYKKFPCADF